MDLYRRFMRACGNSGDKCVIISIWMHTIFRRVRILNLHGIVIGSAVFLITGIFHPIVIKGEYYFGKRIWPAFLLVGLACIVASAFIKGTILSSIIGVVGFSSLWSILELFKQEERVRKGWFPRNQKKQRS